MASPHSAEPQRRSWLKPATWHLRTRLILLAMTLLIAICGAVGVANYASMDAFLTRQLDEQLSQAAQRSNNPGRPPSGGFNGRDPLDSRGQSVGTMNARILNGQVTGGGFLSSNTTRSALSALSAEDKQVLLALRQVLMNLLSNARKHTPPGTTVVTGAGKTPQGAALVTVTDDGGGIPPEFVDKVFARFARADAARKPR